MEDKTIAVIAVVISCIVAVFTLIAVSPKEMLRRVAKLEIDRAIDRSDLEHLEEIVVKIAKNLDRLIEQGLLNNGNGNGRNNRR
jgi:hypothetical protein